MINVDKLKVLKDQERNTIISLLNNSSFNTNNNDFDQLVNELIFIRSKEPMMRELIGQPGYTEMDLYKLNQICENIFWRIKQLTISSTD